MLVIYDGDRLFWSNTWGWGSLDEAERFSSDEARVFQLPIAETHPEKYGVNSAQWLSEVDANVLVSTVAEGV